MIRNQEIQRSPIRVLYEYFERASEELGLRSWLSILRPGSHEKFKSEANDKMSQYLHNKWSQRWDKFLSDPEQKLRWEPWDDPEDEIRSHYSLQAAIVASIMGDSLELMTLRAQLISEPMNRKLTITYFLGNLTEGKVGLVYKELPSRSQILRWVDEMDQIRLTDRLGEIAELKLE